MWPGRFGSDLLFRRSSYKIKMKDENIFSTLMEMGCCVKVHFEQCQGEREMFRKYHYWKRKRKINKVRPGDGRPLKPYRWWHIFTRSLFYIRLVDEDGTENVYAVDVQYFAEEEKADLYKNGKRIATTSLPGIFPVPGGEIEVEMTNYGMKRMHYVTELDERMLSPDPLSMEGLRLRFDKRFPSASNAIKYAAIIILLTSIVLGLPQLLQFITSIPFIADKIGTFESPIHLPEWLNTILFFGGIAAAFERAITLRNHWLIDMDTSWWEG